MKNIKELLEEHPFFKDLNQSQLELLAGCGRNIHFKKGEKIFTEGEKADFFYIIREGKVKLSTHAAPRGDIYIATIENGEILGWSWLIPPHKWAFDAVAQEETSAVALDGKCLRGKCEQDHELGYELLKRFSKVLASRLEKTRVQLLDIYGK